MPCRGNQYPPSVSIKPRRWKHFPPSPTSLLWSCRETVTFCYLLVSSLDLTRRSGTKTSLTRNMPREHEEDSHSDRSPGPTLSPRGKRGPVATRFPFPEPWGPERAAVGRGPVLHACWDPVSRDQWPLSDGAPCSISTHMRTPFLDISGP